MTDKFEDLVPEWNGNDWVTGKTRDWFIKQLKDCLASNEAKLAAIRICRSYNIGGLSDPGYIANTIQSELNKDSRVFVT